MFKIPAWEDDVPKSDAIALPIMQKVKVRCTLGQIKSKAAGVHMFVAAETTNVFNSLRCEA